MKCLYIIFTVILLVGCGEYEYRYRDYDKLVYNCDIKTSQERSEFILKCIDNGNPKSDEEPEDWMPLCQRFAEETFCKQETVTIKQVKICKGCYWEDLSIIGKYLKK